MSAARKVAVSLASETMPPSAPMPACQSLASTWLPLGSIP